MKYIDDTLINKLAEEYSCTKNSEVLYELFVVLNIFLKTEANKASRRAANTKLNIPSQDFESRYYEAVWQAANCYSIEKGKFMSRLWSFLRLRESDVWRMYQTKGCETDKNGKRYDKAAWLNMDQTISDENGISLADVLLPSCESAEDYLFRKTEEQEIHKKIKDFEERNSKFAKVIWLIFIGATNRELAYAFGEEIYNAKIRQLVKRSKESFKRFIEEDKIKK